MTRAGGAFALLALLAACGGPRGDLVVLMPDPDDGGLGRAVVTAAGDSVALIGAGEGTRVSPGRAPTAPAPVAAAEIDRLFRGAIAVRPAAPRQFLLNFATGSDQLTAASRALLPEIVAEVGRRPGADLSIIGHTDTEGDAATNAALGLRRAELVRDLLVAAGLDPARMSVRSHGETDLLVPTLDNTAEAGNRRVEVTVR